MSQPRRSLRDSGLLDRLMTGATLSNREVARRVGCSHQMIAALRTGARKACRAPLAEAIGTELGIDPNVLFLPSLSPVRDESTQEDDTKGGGFSALTIPDAAARLGCSRQHVYRLINLGVLDSINIASPGARRTKQRVTTAALQGYLDALNGSTRPQVEGVAAQ